MDLALIQSCSICHGALADEPEFSIPDCCGHVFHKGCLATWFESRQPFTCPLCRQAGRKMISIKLVVEPPPRNPNGGEAMDAIGAAALKSKFEKLQEEFKSVTVKLQEVERSVEKQKSDNNAIQQRVQDIDRANTELSAQLRVREQQLKKQRKELVVYRQSELEIQGEELERDIWQEFTELENDQQCNYLKSMMLQVKNLRRECDAKGAKLLAVQQDLEKAAAMGTRTENSNPTNHGNVTGKTVLQDPYERPKKKIRPMFRTSPLF